MTRLIALPIAAAGLFLTACGHGHHHHHGASNIVAVPAAAQDGFAPTNASGDTQSYMPADSCAGRNAHSSGRLVGNISGGTRYECSGFATAPVAASAATTTRSYTTAPRTTTRSYSAPATSTYSYSQSQPTRSYTQPTTSNTTRTYTTTPSHTYTTSPQPSHNDGYTRRQTGTTYPSTTTQHHAPRSTYSTQGTTTQRETYQYIPGVPSTRTYTIPSESDLQGK